MNRIPHEEFAVAASDRKSKRIISRFWQSELTPFVFFSVDIVLIIFSAQLSWFWRFGLGSPDEQYVLAVILGCLLWSAIGFRENLFHSTHQSNLLRYMIKTARAWILLAAGVLATLFATKSGSEFSRLWAGVWFLLGGSLLTSSRIVWTLLRRKAEADGSLAARIAIIGDAKKITELDEYLNSSKNKVNVVGRF